MKIASSAFTHGGDIPLIYSQHGDNVSPPLIITELPKNARSVALIVDDPDAPKGTYTHWVLFNIPPNTGVIFEDSVPVGARQGKNDNGDPKYRGPKPPSGTHRYYFRAHALDCELDLPEGVHRQELEAAMKNHVIDSAEWMGRYTAGTN